MPVTSAVGSVHQGGNSFFGASNAVGYMRISPNGQKLALAQRENQFELYDFNSSTGTVANYQSLTGANNLCYGIEFSPDNSRLYTTMYTDGGGSTSIYQYNLLAGSGTAIQNSRQIIGSVSGLSTTIQAAPNGKLYLSAYNKTYLNAINQPNALGSACSFQENAVALGIKQGQNGLPNFPNAFGSLVTSTVAKLNATTAVYPNPARTQISISLPEDMRMHSVVVSLVNALGQNVLQQTFGAQQHGALIILPVADISKGIYTVQITSAAGKVNKKIVVE